MASAGSAGYTEIFRMWAWLAQLLAQPVASDIMVLEEHLIIKG
jgi:hypothetical protein